MFLRERREVEVVSLLDVEQILPNAKDVANGSVTAAHLAVLYLPKLSIIKKLFRHGADFSISDAYGNSPIDCARELLEKRQEMTDAIKRQKDYPEELFEERFAEIQKIFDFMSTNLPQDRSAEVDRSPPSPGKDSGNSSMATASSSPTPDQVEQLKSCAHSVEFV